MTARMGDAEWRAAVTDTILTWGPEHFQMFPWRRKGLPPWQGLLAEVFLQRTRAAQAEKIFSQLESDYPTAAELHTASPDELAELVHPLGLRWRVRLIQALIDHIQKTDGVIPETLEGLEGLPGVGPYAAAATLSLHLNRRAVLIDSNVVRLLARLTGNVWGPETRRTRWMRELADSLTPSEEHRVYNYGLLDLAMTVCVSGEPRCSECPLTELCCWGSDRRGC